VALETLAAPPARVPSREERDAPTAPSEEIALLDDAGIPAEGIRASVARFGREKTEDALAVLVWRAHRLPEKSCRAIARRAVVDALGGTHDVARREEFPSITAMIEQVAGNDPKGARIITRQLQQNPSLVDALADQLRAAKAEAAKVAIRKQVGIERAPAPTTRSQVGTAHRATRAARTRTARRTAAGATSASGSRSGGDDDSGEADEPPERPGENGGTRRFLWVERRRKRQAAIALIEELCAPECEGRLVKIEAARRGISDWELRRARELLGVVFERRGRRADHHSVWMRPGPQVERRPRYRSQDFKQPGGAAFLEARERWRNRPLGRAMGAGE